MFLAALDGSWVLGFWLLAAALTTDFFDGLAAKKLHAESKIGAHFDRVSDFTVACLGMLALALGANTVSLQLLWLAVPLTLYIGYVKFFRADETTALYRWTSVVSILLLFGSWIFVLWGFAAEAFGWSWWYPFATFVLLTVAALLKRHRLRSWFGWLAERKKA